MKAKSIRKSPKSNRFRDPPPPEPPPAPPRELGVLPALAVGTEAEVTAMEAASLLGISRSTLNNLLSHSRAGKMIQWRWTSEQKGKRLFNLASIRDFRRATSDPEFGRWRKPGR